MRGDSLRDFYAKTLALCGLGVLAGTGALVDYWPSGVTFPVVESTLQRPQIAGPMHTPDIDLLPEPVAPSRPAPTLVAVRTLPPVQLPDHELTLPALNQERDPTLVHLVASFDTPSLVPVEAFTMVSSDSAALGEEIPLSEPTLFRSSDTLSRSGSTLAMSIEDDRTGLLTGAVKRTGSSIARTGRRTGASILDAFRVVSGAVRKALPN